MINTITDVAKSLYEKRLEELEEFLQIITHPGTRGDMFENLTKDIIYNSFKDVPNLHVCDGFIKNYRTNQISPQTDTIVYMGDNAKTIPGGETKIVDIDDVIAFVEVKKTLGKPELHDFYEKQGKVYELVDENGKYDTELFSVVTKQIFGMNEITNEKLLSKSKLAYYLYHILKVEMCEPLRICFGYEGFKKEKTLRDNLFDVIMERGKSGKAHTGINSLPSLVISEENCLVKMIGYPYACSFYDPYNIMQSIQGNALKVFLQMLICKIESKIGHCFALDTDDFSVFKFHRYLAATIDEFNNDATKYYYLDYKEEDLKKGGFVEREWKPTIISEYEYIVVSMLSDLSYEKNPSLDISNKLFEGHNLEEELKNLIKDRIISIHDNMVELITTSCKAGIIKGEYMVGEDNAGQFTSWVFKNGFEK